MLKRQYDVVTQEPYLQEVTGAKRKFRRTISTLAWPYADKRGCVIAMGEILTAPNTLGARRHIHVLAEKRSDSNEELMQEASLFKSRYLCGSVITPSDDIRYTFLEEYNDRQRKSRLPCLRSDDPVFFHASGAGLLPFYIGLMRRRITDEKSIFFGDVCTARDEMMRITNQKNSSSEESLRDMHSKMIELPAISALCWAVEFFDQNTLLEWGEKRTSIENIADFLGGY